MTDLGLLSIALCLLWGLKLIADAIRERKINVVVDARNFVLRIVRGDDLDG